MDPQDCLVIAFYPDYHVDSCDIIGGSSGPTVHLGPQTRTTWFFLLHPLCSLQLQRQSSHWVIPLMCPNQMLLHHRPHTDEDLALSHAGDISNVIKSMYDNSWPNYTKIPVESKEQ
ncbi:uncharacterized protein DS421_2g53660 [Arachis hypogaea]|nr:uncharacterized protein DS421_2g53660 [Arachis hypogaea]